MGGIYNERGESRKQKEEAESRKQKAVNGS
jgi:hypothetical protein